MSKCPKHDIWPNPNDWYDSGQGHHIPPCNCGIGDSASNCDHRDDWALAIPIIIFFSWFGIPALFIKLFGPTDGVMLLSLLAILIVDIILIWIFLKMQE